MLEELSTGLGEAGVDRDCQNGENKSLGDLVEITPTWENRDLVCDYQDV